MRQVPRYLLIGNGRVSKHFQHYFKTLGLTLETWQRQAPVTELQAYLTRATHILLLIKDGAIEDFIKQHLLTTAAIRIHFSGSLVTDLAYGAHPLCSFSHTLFDDAVYREIPFIVDEHAPVFSELLPGIPNKHVSLARAHKAKYHALCVLSGNFSCLLWQKLFATLEHEFAIPAAYANVYLQQVTQNLVANYATALTGPLIRNDVTTINKNLAALNGDPFHAVYETVVTCYKQLHNEEVV